MSIVLGYAKSQTVLIPWLLMLTPFILLILVEVIKNRKQT